MRIKISIRKRSVDHGRSRTTKGNRNHRHHHRFNSILTSNSTKIHHSSDFHSKNTDQVNTFHKKTKKTKLHQWMKKGCLIGFISSVLLTICIICALLFSRKSDSINKLILLRWNTTGTTIAGLTGQSGSNASQLNAPWDIALDSSNNFYVSDYYNHRVQKFIKDSSIGITVAGYGNGSSGTNLSALRNPLGIVLDENQNVYIADVSNQRIVCWSNGASVGSLIAGNGTIGNTSNLLNSPYGLAYDRNSKTIYSTEYYNYRVLRFYRNNSTGTLITGGNGLGLNSTQLYWPHAIHFDSLTNTLLIVNAGANNVVRSIINSTEWTFVLGDLNGLSGNSSSELASPTDVTVDPMGNIYVVDRNNHRIQFFSMDSLINGTTIAGKGTVSGSNATLLKTPSSLTLDNQLNLYVVDRGNHRIQKFERY